MRNIGTGLVFTLLGLLTACSVWPVNQDPAGMEYRREANEIIFALQSYHHDKGAFPATLTVLAPSYMPEVPHVPALNYNPLDGSLQYAYIPSWPQLRPVHCTTIGNSTDWRCAERLVDQPM